MPFSRTAQWKFEYADWCSSVGYVETNIPTLNYESIEIKPPS